MLLVLAAALALQISGEQTSNCLGEEGPWLNLSYTEFESKRSALSMDEGCLRRQVALIGKYRDGRYRDMKLLDLYNSAFHQGQLMAMLGLSSEAVPYLLAGVFPGRDPGDFSDYALGTVAFLQRDHESLEAARSRLFNRTGDNLNVAALDGLLACFDETYAVAYSLKCRPKHKK